MTDNTSIEVTKQKTILMVGYDFPASNRAAVQRNMSFAFHLQSLGWKVIFLSVKESCYEFIDINLLIDPQLTSIVHRTSAFNSRKVFGYKDKFIDIFSLPDEWVSWYFTAVPTGLSLIRKHKPDMIWSTFPISTAHLIALTLKKITGLPWIADYQDPIAGSNWSGGVRGLVWAIQKLDSNTVKYADKVVLATDAAKEHYAQYHARENPEKFVTIENGYYDLPNINRASRPEEKINRKKYTFLYSGAIYGQGRNPETLFSALSELMNEKSLNPEIIEIVFQGPFLEKMLKDRVEFYGLGDFISFEGSCSFGDSLQRMADSDALILIQGKEFNLPIPGKAYEYIAAGKPILGICHPDGATHGLLRSLPNAHSVWQVSEIKSVINDLLLSRNEARASHDIERFSRLSKAKELNSLIENIQANR